MNRILPILTITLLLVLGGLWLSRRSVAESAAAPPTTPAEALAPPARPDGFSFTPFLSEEPKRDFESAEEVLEQGVDYQAILETSKGVLRIDLFEDEAPITVNNFVFLARNHYYDGVVFHRVLEDFMAQTGDPTGTGTGGPGYQFAQEVAEGLEHDKRGVVSMANAGPDTNGSQFFITFGPTPHLDGDFNIFGQVVEGDEVLDELTRINPGAPSAVVPLSGVLTDLEAQGIELAGDGATPIESYLEASLGALPSPNQTFTLDGYTGVLGTAGGSRAVGFFPKADVIERVYIIQRPKGA